MPKNEWVKAGLVSYSQSLFSYSSSSSNSSLYSLLPFYIILLTQCRPSQDSYHRNTKLQNYQKVFHEAEQLFGYGLNAPKGAAKSFQLVLQVF